MLESIVITASTRIHQPVEIMPFLQAGPECPDPRHTKSSRLVSRILSDELAA
jgi:hypothetical protein